MTQYKRAIKCYSCVGHQMDGICAIVPWECHEDYASDGGNNDDCAASRSARPLSYRAPAGSKAARMNGNTANMKEFMKTAVRNMFFGKVEKSIKG